VELLEAVKNVLQVALSSLQWGEKFCVAHGCKCILLLVCWNTRYTLRILF
jgi:hypothetical protein